MDVPQFVIDFANEAIIIAQRFMLHQAEHVPVIEAIMLSVGDGNNLHGARVFFQPPLKAVWVNTGRTPSQPYEIERKKDTPLSDTYYVFNVTDLVVDSDSIVIWEAAAAA